MGKGSLIIGCNSFGFFSLVLPGSIRNGNTALLSGALAEACHVPVSLRWRQGLETVFLSFLLPSYLFGFAVKKGFGNCFFFMISGWFIES